jgi:hypothetical protein
LCLLYLHSARSDQPFQMIQEFSYLSLTLLFAFFNKFMHVVKKCPQPDIQLIGDRPGIGGPLEYQQINVKDQSSSCRQDLYSMSGTSHPVGDRICILMSGTSHPVGDRAHISGSLEYQQVNVQDQPSGWRQGTYQWVT